MRIIVVNKILFLCLNLWVPIILTESKTIRNSPRGKDVIISNPNSPLDLLNEEPGDRDDRGGNGSSSHVTVTDEEFLRFFYSWTNGVHWNTKAEWLKPENEVLYCDWFGITCSDTVTDSNGLPRVTRIELPNNNLQGAVPLHLLIRTMTELQRLDLHGNDISFDKGNVQSMQLFGVQPDHRQMISKLQYLDLSYTHGAQSLGSFIFDINEENSSSSAGIIHMPQLTDLYLSHAHIIGTLPSILFSGGYIDNLERLVLDGNDITGPIPHNIGTLIKLRLLSMRENELTGFIPETISHLENVRSIILRSNKLHGPLPGESHFCVGNSILTYLEVLDLSHQDGVNPDGTKGLDGPLPSFEHTQTLKQLDLSYNSLTGAIPDNFLANVDTDAFQFARLRHNQLGGHIPAYTLTSLPFDAISLEGNKFTSIDNDLCDPSRDGAIASFGCDAFLCAPGFYGPEIGHQTDLSTKCQSCQTNTKYWGLTNCDETSTNGNNYGPSYSTKPNTFPPTLTPTHSTKISEKDILMGLFKKTGGSNWNKNNGWMESFSLQQTKNLTSEDSFCNWYGVTCGDIDKYGRETVVSLQLGSNNLRGKPPKAIFLLSNLETLDLGRNSILFDFEGIHWAKKIENLNLAACGIEDLTGLNLPNVVATLKELHLESNGFSQDGLPQEIYSLTNLEELYLDNNKFTGKISEQIQSLRQLTTFSAGNNLLTGFLPPEMIKLSNLSILRLHNNLLSGELSPVVTSLKSLSVLNLSNQRSSTHKGIIGKLPTFEGFSKLRRLNLEVNGLTGSLPESFLEGSITESYEFVDLSYNFLDGNVPSQFASLNNVYLKGNEFTSIDEEVCNTVKGTRFESFGCNAVLCPPGTYNSLGRQSSFDSPCVTCSITSSKRYYGMTTCPDVNNPTVDNGNSINIDNIHQIEDSSQGTPETILKNPSTRSEKDILTVLYTNCGGRQWVKSNNWINRNVDVCVWFGITCNENKKVRKIELRSNGLVGEIPQDLFHLRELEELLIDGNRISFDFHSIGNARSLIKLDLSRTDLKFLKGIEKATKLTEVILTSNDLYGTFPSEILQLTNLELLHLDLNSLQGSLPDNLKLLSNLENLVLNNNKFEGTIPDFFAPMKNLHLLNLASNGFSGDIPQSLHTLKNLHYLDISDQKGLGGNGLDGNLPAFAGLQELERLDLSGNSLKGSIPPNLLSSIRSDIFQYLDLKDNDLSGTVPEIMANINVDKYDFSNNKITGIDNKLCNPSRGSLIEQFGCDAVLCPPLTFNSDGRQSFDNHCKPCISLPKGIYGSTTCAGEKKVEPTSTPAPLPSVYSEWEILSLFFDSCGGNFWTHKENWGSTKSICDWFGVGCPSSGEETVEVLTLSTNNVKGLIPNELFFLPNLKTLVLDSNAIFFNFSGIENAKKLNILDLSATHLHTLDGIEKGQNLLELQLASNDIENSFPESLFSLTSLKKLTLDFNKISGSLPSKIGRLSNLELLSAVSNQITGSIPKSIENLSDLATLHLQHNSMNGPLPDEFAKLPKLTLLDLSHQISETNSGFSGSLPSFKEQRDISRINLSSNSLTGTIPVDFLINANYYKVQSVDLRNNHLSGEVPSMLSKISELSLQDNEITSVQDYCEVKEATVMGEFDCSEFLCPPKTYSTTGKKDKVATCQDCSTVNFFGSTTCGTDPLSRPNVNKRPTANIPENIDTSYERKVLENLYVQCNGYGWHTDNNWVMSDISVCNWVGVDCVPNTESIKSINLGSNNLKGTIPKEIFALPNLESLALYSNPIDGIDFSEISRANNLHELLIDATNIASFDGISKAPQLKRLNMRQNSIKSEFPTEILKMPTLTSLNLGHNLISGSLPSNLNVLTNLKSLLLTDNDFNGDLSGFKLPSSLETLDLSKNVLIGTIPSSFLSNQQTDVKLEIDLSNNLLTGVIPSELNRFDYMNLYLQNNYIAGFTEERSICTKQEWNNGEVGHYGCNAILCPPGTYASSGRQISEKGCQDCESADFYGTTVCLSQESTYSSSSARHSQPSHFFYVITAMIGFCTTINLIL